MYGMRINLYGTSYNLKSFSDFDMGVVMWLVVFVWMVHLFIRIKVNKWPNPDSIRCLAQSAVRTARVSLQRCRWILINCENDIGWKTVIVLSKNPTACEPFSNNFVKPDCTQILSVGNYYCNGGLMN